MTKKIFLTMIIYVGSFLVEIILNANLSLNSNVTYESAMAGVSQMEPVSEPIIKEQILYKDVRGTVYHAEEKQTDSTPLITADNSRIDTARVNKLRWIAVSRDLINLKTSRYNFNGKLKFGDTVWVSYDRKAVLEQAKREGVGEAFLIRKYDKVVGWWVVKDTMGEYNWAAQKSDSTTFANMKAEPAEYKLKDGVVFKKHYQRNWIDFLQHPKTGMLHHWNKCLIITKRKVVGHKPIAIASR
jgi:hypothetical protein